jgi:hypothetical protein
MVIPADKLIFQGVATKPIFIGLVSGKIYGSKPYIQRP